MAEAATAEAGAGAGAVVAAGAAATAAGAANTAAGAGAATEAGGGTGAAAAATGGGDGGCGTRVPFALTRGISLPRRFDCAVVIFEASERARLNHDSAAASLICRWRSSILRISLIRSLWRLETSLHIAMTLASSPSITPFSNGYSPSIFARPTKAWKAVQSVFTAAGFAAAWAEGGRTGLPFISCPLVAAPLASSPFASPPVAAAAALTSFGAFLFGCIHRAALCSSRTRIASSCSALCTEPREMKKPLALIFG